MPAVQHPLAIQRHGVRQCQLEVDSVSSRGSPTLFLFPVVDWIRGHIDRTGGTSTTSTRPRHDNGVTLVGCAVEAVTVKPQRYIVTEPYSLTLLSHIRKGSSADKTGVVLNLEWPLHEMNFAQAIEWMPRACRFYLQKLFGELLTLRYLKTCL